MNKKIEKAVLASLRQAVAIREGTARPAKRYSLASRTALPRDRALRERNGTVRG